MSFFQLVRNEMQGSLGRLVFVSAMGGVSTTAIIGSINAGAQAADRGEISVWAAGLFIIAMGLLPSLSIPHVLQKMAQGLRYVWPDPDITLPGASALSYRREQLGVEPLRQLFQKVCQPRATTQTPGGV